MWRVARFGTKRLKTPPYLKRFTATMSEKRFSRSVSIAVELLFICYLTFNHSHGMNMTLECHTNNISGENSNCFIR